tara:strand:- start:57 stop:209 length:153 start_codon:yes stop_codon:yes gene_type:complete
MILSLTILAIWDEVLLQPDKVIKEIINRVLLFKIKDILAQFLKLDNIYGK